MQEIMKDKELFKTDLRDTVNNDFAKVNCELNTKYYFSVISQSKALDMKQSKKW